MSDHHSPPNVASTIDEAIELVERIRYLRRFVQLSADLTEEFARRSHDGWPSNAASKLASLLRERVNWLGLNLPGDELLIERLAIAAAQVDRTAVEMLDAAERKLVTLFRSESPRWSSWPTSGRIEFRSLSEWQRKAVERAARDAGVEPTAETRSRAIDEKALLTYAEFEEGAACFCDESCIGYAEDERTGTKWYWAQGANGERLGEFPTAGEAALALCALGQGPAGIREDDLYRRELRRSAGPEPHPAGHEFDAPASPVEIRNAGLEVTDRAPPAEGGAS